VPFSATRDLWLVLKARDEGSRAMRSFSRDIRMVGDNVRMANLQASRSALINTMATQRLSGASQQQLLVTQGRIQATDQEIGQMRVARAAMEEQRVSAQKLGTALQGASSIMTTLGTAAVAVGVFGVMGLNSLVKAAVDYEKQSAMTVTQVDKFATSLKDVEDIGLRVAKAIGVPFQEIQPALYDIFSSMEIGAKDAEAVLTTFARAAVAGQTDISAVSRATIGILNAFQLPLTDLNHLMDVQFQLVKEGIGTYEEWTQRIGLVTPSAARFGQTVEMMAAALAASTRMGISAARSGTAVARAMDAMSNPVAVQNLQDLGVAATDAEGNFRPMIDILKDFRAKLEGLPEEEKIKKILDVFKGAGGTIEARRFLQNMLILPGNLETFQTIFETMSTESGSFEQAYATMADTTAVKTELMKNQWQTVKIAMGQYLQPAFEKIIGFLTRIFQWFNNLTPEQQKFITKIIAWGVVLSIVGGILLLLVGTLTAFAAAVAVAGSSLFIILGILGGVAVGFAALAAAVYLAWQKSTDFRTLVRYVADEVSSFYTDTLLPMAQAIQTAWNDKVLPPLNELWSIIDARVLPALRHMAQVFTSEAMQAAKELANDLKDGLIWAFGLLKKIIEENIIPAIAVLTAYYNEHKDAIDKIIVVVVFLAKWFLIIAAIVTGVLVVVFVGPLVAAFAAVAAVIGMTIATIVQLVEWFQIAKQKVGEFIDWVKGSFNTATLHGIGQALIDGLINGIESKFGSVAAVIRNLGSLAVSALKGILGIGSPSKEFMKLGQYSMEGYALGLKKAAPAITAQVTATTGNLTTAAGSVDNGRGSSGGGQQNFYITTQEISPRRHAAELGYLLSGRS
jgi:TP901 family phage tail tape measure protein